MDRPAIKGAVIDHLVADVNRLREAGRISPEQLEVRLQAEDLELLERKPLPSGWYPIECYRRLIELLLDLDGFGSRDYLRMRGQAAAARMIESGVYQQMDRLKAPVEASASIEQYLRRTKLTVSVYGAVLNFTRWKVTVDPDHPRRVQIEVTESEDYPEVLRYTTEGFLTRSSQERGYRYAWVSERREPGRILFRMDRDFDA